MTAASASEPPSALQDPEIDEDWEEWDGRSPFWMHCVAGSLAGLVEHSAVYPLDTVRTHIQVCASCVKNPANFHPSTKATSALSSRTLPVGMWQTILYLTRPPPPATIGSAAALSTTTSSTDAIPILRGLTRLWRGVQTMFVGCIPAHALYFSSYEVVKAATSDSNGQATYFGSSLAGAAAVVSHDIIMTPLDTVKQRLQLGHYSGTRQALQAIINREGAKALYRSFPITLASNVPYGMVMVSTHEVCKQAWRSPDTPAWQTVLAASSMAGCLAATVTTPLDRIKTALQTQQLQPACFGAVKDCPVVVKHATWQDAARSIYRTEGWKGFVRGMVPRVLSHTPAVAISWTTYETAKHYLLQHCGD